MKNIMGFDKYNESNSSTPINIVLGTPTTIFNGFDVTDESEQQYLQDHDGKVKLGEFGFAEEWQELVDYDLSFAYIEAGKLYVTVYGIPSSINPADVIEFFTKTMDHYLTQGYGEFFETEPGNPMCMKVTHNGTEVVV